jgi:hypothetical protein
MSYIGNQPSNTSFLSDTFSGNGITTVFTMAVAPANTAAVIVAIWGVLQDPTTYSVVGRILTFSQAPPTGPGNISVRYLALPSSNVTTTAYRSVTEFTATAGQTTFTPASYTPGFISVFRSGVRLGASNFTATNGVTVVLSSPAAADDLITIESFFVSSVLNAIPAIPGQITPALLDSTSQLGSGALLLPAGTSAQRPAIPQVGMQRWNTTLQAMEVFVGAGVWQLIASSSYAVEYLVVAGGGGGGYQVGGGGGAGGLLTSTFNTNPASSYSITVGGGGVGGGPTNVIQGANGTNSTIAGVATAIGGGRGSNHPVGQDVPGNGGSGGGGSGNSASQNVLGGTGTAGQGNNGGTGLASSWAGGGGGGANAVGANATPNTGGPGGAGRTLTQFSAVGGSPAGSFAGGGGGCSSGEGGTPRVLGGIGGGGEGYANNGAEYGSGTTGGDAVINTGGGGGGVRDRYNGSSSYTRAGNGASGIVILRYAGTPRGTGGTVIQSGGFTHHVFTSSGTFTA